MGHAHGACVSVCVRNVTCVVSNSHLFISIVYFYLLFVYVQIWDMRKTAGCERNIQSAHQGLVACIDWHPEDSSLIASGGRDRVMKV